VVVVMVVVVVVVMVDVRFKHNTHQKT